MAFCLAYQSNSACIQNSCNFNSPRHIFRSIHRCLWLLYRMTNRFLNNSIFPNITKHFYSKTCTHCVLKTHSSVVKTLTMTQFVKLLHCSLSHVEWTQPDINALSSGTFTIYNCTEKNTEGPASSSGTYTDLYQGLLYKRTEMTLLTTYCLYWI